MIDAGSGYPPHWRGEPAESNLATATAMQAPTERHLIRRQKYFSYMLQDIVFNAYVRAVQVGKARKIAEDDYEQLFIVSAPDVSRTDNEALARASRDVATAFDTLSNNLVLKDRPVLAKLLMRMIFKFAGEPQNDEVLNQLLAEMPNNAPEDGGSSEEED